MTDIVGSQLAFSFGTEPVLKNINISCQRGEFVSILGGSGCGKSTLLRLFAGLIVPTQGTVNLFDDAPAEVSFVFQKPTLCPWLTVLQNVELPRKLRGIPVSANKEEIYEALKLVELSPRDANKLPHQLSGGMQMRVSLARALTTTPRIMLMDEPFSALDEVLRQQLSEKCLELWRKQKWTTVFVTHNVQDAVFMSEKIHILAGKPATIVDTIEVVLPARTEEVRTSPEYIRQVSEVGQRLRSAVDRAANVEANVD